MRVAIQGEAGSFHDSAARRWFTEPIDLVPADTFSNVFRALESGQADTGVVAIENSLYGSINQVYDLIESHHYPIVGEIHLPVHQQLIGTPDHTITHIYSHPVALAQCEAYLDAHYPDAERIEHHDTAGAVEYIATTRDPQLAAIASADAAAMYHMAILKENIEDNPANFTRFLVIKPHGSAPDNADRSSIVITTNHVPGALAKVLTTFADADINLSKLQSRPIVGTPWKYRFHITLDTAGAKLHETLDAIAPFIDTLTVLGEYHHDAA